MKKLYICEYPYVLYKALIDRMNDEENTFSIILGDSRNNFEPMVSVLRRSELFEQVEFFPSAPYRNFYDLFITNIPFKTISKFKNYLRVIWRLKKFKKVAFPFELNLRKYDKIICSEGVYVMIGYLNTNQIEYSISEHAKDSYLRGVRSKGYIFSIFILSILDRLHLLIGPGPAAGFCKEIIVNDAIDIAWPIRRKKVTSWNVDKHIEALDKQQRDRIFRLYAEAYGVKFEVEKIYDLLLTNPLAKDGFLPSEDSQIKFYKDTTRNYFHHPILIKPHPRDTIDYKKHFPECIIINQNISSEILNFSQDLKLGTVLTLVSSSGASFQEKAERLIVLEESGTPAHQMKSLEAYR